MIKINPIKNNTAFGKKQEPKLSDKNYILFENPSSPYYGASVILNKEEYKTFLDGKKSENRSLTKGILIGLTTGIGGSIIGFHHKGIGLKDIAIATATIVGACTLFGGAIGGAIGYFSNGNKTGIPETKYAMQIADKMSSK